MRCVGSDTLEFRPRLLHENLSAMGEQGRREARLSMTSAMVREIPGFKDLGVYKRRQLIEVTRYQAFRESEYVYQAGEHASRFYVIVAGRVEVLYDDKQITTLGEKECFGEVEIIVHIKRILSVSARQSHPSPP